MSASVGRGELLASRLVIREPRRSVLGEIGEHCGSSAKSAGQFVRQPLEIRIGLDHPAVVERQDPVGHIEDAGVVRDNHHGASLGARQRLNDVDDFVARVGVERGRRLVGHDHARLAGEGSRDRHPLLLSAGQFPRPLMLVAAETDAGEQGIRHGARHWPGGR